MKKITAPNDRPVTISTTGGVTVRLAAGETRAVQDFIAVEAVKHRCTVNDAEQANAPSDFDRTEALREAIRRAVETGDPQYFTGQGKPKVAVVRELSGIEGASASEVNALFDELSFGD